MKYCNICNTLKSSHTNSCPICNSYFSSMPSETNFLHADLDSFYASVEVIDNPALKGKAVIIASNNKRSVVSTCSYEARKFGVSSAMPLFKAKQKCPHAVIVAPRMKRYMELSKAVFEIFKNYTPDIEPLSIDEAFLDLSGTNHIFKHPYLAAIKIKQEVFMKTGLTISIGVAENKFLAKLASSINKPDGIFLVHPDEKLSWLKDMPVELMWGIGKKTVPLLRKQGLHKFSDLMIVPLSKLERIIGSRALAVKNAAFGIDNRQINTLRERKSIGTELTLAEIIYKKEKLLPLLWQQSKELSRELYLKNITARQITLKLKTKNFKLKTKSITKSQNFLDELEIFNDISLLLEKSKDTISAGIRLAGIQLAKLEETQDYANSFDLFPDKQRKKRERLNLTINIIKDNFGKNSINRGL